jgi:hypothetical protein
MKTGQFEFVGLFELFDKLGSSRHRVEKFLRNPLVEEGVHFYRSTPHKRFWNVELIRDLMLNHHQPEKHKEAIAEFKAQTAIQKGLPSVSGDRPHVA